MQRQSGPAPRWSQRVHASPHESSYRSIASSHSYERTLHRAPVVAKGPWACRRCGLENFEEAPKCYRCRERKPEVKTPSRTLRREDSSASMRTAGSTVVCLSVDVVSLVCFFRSCCGCLRAHFIGAPFPSLSSLFLPLSLS